MNLKNKIGSALKKCGQIIKDNEMIKFAAILSAVALAGGASAAALHNVAAEEISSLGRSAVADDSVKCYSIKADGESVVSLATYAQAQAAADTFEQGFTDEENVIYRNFEIEEDVKEIDNISTVGEAVEILSESDKVLVSYKVENVTEISIPYTQVVIEDENLPKGDEIIEQEGEDGLCKRVVISYYENGVETTSLAPMTTVEKKSVDEIKRVGTGSGLPSKFACPTEGTITSSYGERWGKNHNGTDIGAPIGTEVYAPVGGKVIFAGEKNGYGNYIMVDHGNGDVTAYAHLSEICVSEGDVVSEGDLLGKVGVTGNVTGPHLHFEIIRNGEYIDAEPFIEVDN
jgi:murein DD-endopeptidase MepM/ murein hydrolase activator NlpD